MVKARGDSSLFDLSYPQAAMLCRKISDLTVRTFSTLISGFPICRNQHHETHLPALRRAPQAYPRLPRALPHPWWSCRSRRPSCQGPSSPLRLNAASFRFRPASRLLNGKEYTAVFASRRVLRGGPFELYYRPLTSSANAAGPETPAMPASSAVHSAARLGLVVPKRNAKRAVHRNLVKRLAREAFRHVCSQLPAYDLVFRLGKPLNARTDTLEQQRREWRRQIDELLQRLPRTA